MATLSEILDAAEKLHQLSPEAARRFSFSHGGGCDDTGGCSGEDVKDLSGRIHVSRGRSWSGTSRGEADHWGPSLSIDNKDIEIEKLDQPSRDALNAKIEKAFVPLFKTLKREERAAPGRKVAAEKLAREKAAAEQATRNAEARALIDSL